jgi:predicted RNA-binding Zn-ribbon protein involved in translation (DUF1610 family)
MTTDTGLLPCPNQECGGTNIYRQNKALLYSAVSYWIGCDDCGIKGPSVPAGYGEAARLWNLLPRQPETDTIAVPREDLESVVYYADMAGVRRCWVCKKAQFTDAPGPKHEPDCWVGQLLGKE